MIFLHKNFKYSIFSILLLFATSCANIVPPGGGDRDSKAPVVLRMQPDNAALYVKEKSIRIDFDEFFTLDNPQQNILISPPMDKQPNFTIVGKSLKIDFKSELKPDVTYNISFGNAISDVNEKNILKNFSYVFATGGVLDTMQVKGRIILAATNQPIEDALLCLYTDQNDSIVLKQKPYYYTRTDADGNYNLKNIHPGTYKIVALKDENLDFLYQQNELIAFADSFILNDSTAEKLIDLRMFKEQPAKLECIEVINSAAGVLVFIFNKPIRTFALDANIYSNQDKAVICPTLDTVRYYYTKIDAQNAEIIIRADELIDTIRKELSYIKENEKSKFPLRLVSQTTISSGKAAAPSSVAPQHYQKPYVFSCNRAIQQMDTSLISFFEDSVEIPISMGLFTINKKNPTQLVCSYQFKQKGNYIIRCKNAALTDISNLPSEEFTRTFSTNSSADLGSIIMNNKITSDKKYIIQLKDASDNILYTSPINASSTSKIVIPALASGMYKVFVIEDANGNKRWDSGNYFKRVQAEKIIAVNTKIDLKPGWDFELDIKL